MSNIRNLSFLQYIGLRRPPQGQDPEANLPHLEDGYTRTVARTSTRAGLWLALAPLVEKILPEARQLPSNYGPVWLSVVGSLHHELREASLTYLTKELLCYGAESVTASSTWVTRLPLLAARGLAALYGTTLESLSYDDVVFWLGRPDSKLPGECEQPLPPSNCPALEVNQNAEAIQPYVASSMWAVTGVGLGYLLFMCQKRRASIVDRRLTEALILDAVDEENP